MESLSIGKTLAFGVLVIKKMEHFWANYFQEVS